eukprot:12481069-Alexandrium_andersonii.AAC.1
MPSGTPLCSGVRNCCVFSGPLPSAARPVARSAPRRCYARRLLPEESVPIALRGPGHRPSPGGNGRRAACRSAGGLAEIGSPPGLPPRRVPRGTPTMWRLPTLPQP